MFSSRMNLWCFLDALFENLRDAEASGLKSKLYMCVSWFGYLGIGCSVNPFEHCFNLLGMPCICLVLNFDHCW